MPERVGDQPSRCLAASRPLPFLRSPETPRHPSQPELLWEEARRTRKLGSERSPGVVTGTRRPQQLGTVLETHGSVPPNPAPRHHHFRDCFGDKHSFAKPWRYSAVPLGLGTSCPDQSSEASWKKPSPGVTQPAVGPQESV